MINELSGLEYMESDNLDSLMVSSSNTYSFGRISGTLSFGINAIYDDIAPQNLRYTV